MNASPRRNVKGLGWLRFKARAAEAGAKAFVVLGTIASTALSATIKAFGAGRRASERAGPALAEIGDRSKAQARALEEEREILEASGKASAPRKDNRL